MRFLGLGALTMQKLGVSTQLLPPADVYPALERGVIDATELSMPAVDLKLGFHEIAKHYYFPGWHQPSSMGEFIVNLDRWKALDAADQQFLITACRDVIVRDVALGDYQQIAALRRIQQSGVTLHIWPDEFLIAFKRGWEEVIVENAAKDPDFRKVYASYKAFRDDFAEWDQRSRVPVHLK
jgi:TRAP-type mannitol/chloroaromatic compound transport system substrate-binding protein